MAENNTSNVIDDGNLWITEQCNGLLTWISVSISSRNTIYVT
jgi:hypothetical protein